MKTIEVNLSLKSLIKTSFKLVGLYILASGILGALPALISAVTAVVVPVIVIVVMWKIITLNKTITINIKNPFK